MSKARVSVLILAALFTFNGCRKADPPLNAGETPCGFLNGPEVAEFQGVMTEVGWLYGFHLKYKADREFVLGQLATMPVDASAPSDVGPGDTQPIPIDKAEALDRMTPAPAEFSSLGSWNPEQVQDGTSYGFFRFPWQHTLLFDSATGTVYHYITEVRP